MKISCAEFMNASPLIAVIAQWYHLRLSVTYPSQVSSDLITMRLSADCCVASCERRVCLVRGEFGHNPIYAVCHQKTPVLISPFFESVLRDRDASEFVWWRTCTTLLRTNVRGISGS